MLVHNPKNPDFKFSILTKFLHPIMKKKIFKSYEFSFLSQIDQFFIILSSFLSYKIESRFQYTKFLTMKSTKHY